MSETEERTAMCERFVVDESGLRWDRVAVSEVGTNLKNNPDQMVNVTGLVRGDEGALLLRLPGVLIKDFVLRPAEARALRDALNARVGVAAGREVVSVMIAGGYQETFYANGTSEAHPLYEEEEEEEEEETDTENARP